MFLVPQNSQGESRSDSGKGNLMRRRQGMLLCIAVGLAFVLVVSLISLLAQRQGTAYAQSNPAIYVSIGQNRLPQGGKTYLHGRFDNMPQDPNDDGAFHPDVDFRLDLQRDSDGSWVDENDCTPSLFGKNFTFNTWWRASIGVFGNMDNLVIARNCPVGSYRVVTTARYRSTNTVFVTTTNSLTIINGPQVTIGFSPGPYYRGNEIDVDLEFSYLNNLQDRSGLSYRADIMRIISESSRNYADDCEGTALGNVDKSSDTNNNASNNNDSPSGSIDGQDPDGTVEVDAKVADTCETGTYSLKAELWNTSKEELMTSKMEFVVTTDPNATPFAKMVLSSNAVEVGTEIEYRAKFYDLAAYEGKSVQYRIELTKDGANAPDSCKDGLYDIDVGSRISSNPYVDIGDIPSTCPEGEYTIKAILKDSSGTEILSTSADFTIGDPVDLEPEAPSVSAITTKQNEPFSQQLPEGSGGNGTLTYGATGLPPGLDFSESTRTIHGTPLAHGNFTVRYTVTDDDGDSDYVDISFRVVQDNMPSLVAIQDYTGIEGSLFTEQLPAGTGGDGTLTHGATGLPAGLSFITSTRTITGTPPTAGIGHVDYTATDEDGDVARQSFVITITADSRPVLGSPTDRTGRVGSQFAEFLPQATSGNGTLEYEVSSPLPAGLEFDSSLVKIEGTPTAEGTTTVTLTVTDDDGDTDSHDFQIVIQPDNQPTLAAVDNFTGRVGSPFDGLLPQGSGGDPPLDHDITTTLPDGLTFNETQFKVSGTPTAHGNTDVSYVVTDEDGDQASRTFRITIEQDNQPTLGTIQDYTGIEGSLFTERLPAGTGGDGTLTHDATGLPAGLSFITSTRTITGTPPTAGIGHVDYTATDEDGDVARQSFVITITVDLQPVLGSPTDRTGRVGSQFAEFLPQATGGNGTLEYEVSPPLPAGLEFDSSLVKIEGTPTAEGTTTVTLTVTDDDGDTDSHDFQIVIQPDNQPTLAAVDNFTGRVGSPFDGSLPQGSGGDPPLDHDITSTLPDGITFNEAQFKISGTPTAHGNTDVSYVVTDEDGDQATRSFRITIQQDNQPALGTIPGYNAKVDTLFTQVLIAATGGDGDIGYTADPLPAGLVFVESSRTITGTPSADGTTSVVYTATDEDGDEVQKTFNIIVYLKPSLADVSDVMATKDALFTLELPDVESGRGPFDFTASPRPAGLNFVESSRTITGTPTTVEEVDVTYTVTDDDGDSASVEFKISVSEGDTEPTLQPIDDQFGRKDSPFSFTLPRPAGGNAPYTYTATPLPTGLSFNESDLMIGGTPTQVEDVSVTYTVTDTDLDVASQSFIIHVRDDLMPTLPSVQDFTGLQNSPFSEQLPAGSGGDGTLKYDATGLPAGLSFIATTRTIAGTPSTAGIGNVEYTATDTDGDVARQSFIITITTDLQPVLAPQNNLTGRVGSPFAKFLPQATGGNGTLAYETTTPPPGLTFDDALVKIKGTPTIAGTTIVTLTVRDQDGDEHSLPFDIVIEPDNQPTLTAVANMTGRVGSPFSESLPQGSGGDGDHDHDITTTLPDGLVFDEAMFKISGTPTAHGNTVVSYVVTDEDGDQASQSFTITIEQDGQPALDPVTSMNAKVGTLFTKVLDPATGGDSDLEYNAAPLPPGLTFIQSNRTISGTPTTQGTTTVEYTATDGDDTATKVDDDVARRSFNIVVYPVPTLPAVSNVMATQDAVFTLELPAVLGGRGDFEYTANPLPDGLTFVESTRTITGTPTTVQDIDVTYKVTDADDDTASVEFKISVSEGDTSPTLQSISDQYARKDSPFSFTLPRPAGGNAPYTYTATPLPTGLSFNESELMIKGTPTQVEDVSVTYTVTDVDLDVASRSFTIHVSDDLMPSFSDIDDFEARVDSPFSTVLPEAISGDLPITYTATNLPDGLTFAPDSRTISGTPTSTATKTVTYGAEDEDGDKDSVEFDIVVSPDSQPSLPAVDDFRARRGDPLEKQLPPAAGGDGTLVYSAQGLPPGLDFIATTQIITGTPTRDGNFTVTYAVVDEDNDRSSVQFDIDVAENWHSNNNNNDGSDTGRTTPTERNTKELDNQPALGKIPDYDAKVDTMFTQNLIAATGGDGDIGYTAAPLPPGLNFIESSRTITGKPTTGGTTSVVYTATDEDGDKVHRTFDIVVYLKPSLADVSDVMATKDAVFTLDLPDVEGGRGPFDFTAGPRPAGLDFIESSRTITGTPTTVEEVDVTYTVTDADGDSATVEFKISVSEGDTSPTLQTVNAQYARKDSPFSFMLPRPAGGNAPYSYSAAPLPTGLSFNETELKIEGTPTQVEDVSVTYTVTDTDLDVASQSFTIHVSDDLIPSFTDIDDFEARVDSPFSKVLPEAISGDLPIIYTATNLPDGLTFAPGSRTIYGTPTSPVTKTVTYGAEDEDGDKVSTTFKIAVAENRQSNPPNNNNNVGKSNSGNNKGSTNSKGSSNNGGTNNGGSNNGGTSIGGASIDGTSNGGTSNGGTNTRYDPGGNYGGGTGNNHFSPNPCLTPINGAPSIVPVATTAPYLLNVRQGPGLHYAVVTTVPRGTQANIYGRDTLR